MLASLEHVEALTRLFAEFRDHLGLSSPTDSAFRQRLESAINDDQTIFFLSSCQNGFLQLRLRDNVWTGVPLATLEDAFVSEVARGQGLGTALMFELLELCRQRKCDRVEVDANSGNTGAIAFYERIGFAAHSPIAAGTKDLLLRYWFHADNIVGQPLLINVDPGPHPGKE